MDAETSEFLYDIATDPWLALELPLPQGLDLAALDHVRLIVWYI
jgi:hypothetical protein